MTRLSHSKSLRWTWLLPVAWLAAAMAVPHRAPEVANRAGARLADAGTLGPQECAECHVEEFAAWQESQHQLASKGLTRNPEASTIAKALGIRRIKNEARCTSCHYTVQLQGEKEKALAGVSCESCHGPAADWMGAHDDFGGATPAEETPEHRSARLAQCDEAGMKHPGELYALAARCYACHTIADEELVDVGGHPTGAGFELLAYSQGEVLHNYVRGAGKNVPADAQRRRALFLVGQLLELESVLRALAAASGSGSHAEALTQRATAAREALVALDAGVDLPALQAAITAVDGLVLAPGDAEALFAAADAIAQAGQAADLDVDLSSIDALLPPADTVRGVPAE